MSGKTRGYDKPLMIMPFDHRGSFQSKMFGVTGTPTAEETQKIASFKTVIYEGFEKARESLPKDQLGVLIDEQFGEEVIERARKAGVKVSLCCEKSGQEEFDFEYGDAYQDHIKKWNPDFTKVLVRYNPEGDAQMNQRQAARLADLSQFLGSTDRKFIFELLVPATAEQKEKCGGDTEVYDREMRPKLMVGAIQALLKAGVEPDVWKLEGLDREADYQAVVDATREGGRSAVGTIVLGRGANEEKVRHWLKTGANVDGVIGFAVGRTIFWSPLEGLRDGKLTREQAVDQIAENYGGFCRYWLEQRN